MNSVMKANPGGQIDPEAVVGRSSQKASLWETLDHQSVVITAERRIGKTTLLRMMLNDPAPGWTAVYQDLERCHSAHEFAMEVYREIDGFLGRKQRFARRTRELLQTVGGVEIGGVKLPAKGSNHWKEVLRRSVEDLVGENDASGSRLLFLWDEMALMLQNIRRAEGEPVAMEVLDELRALRQTHGGLRMVITGSIGLHHVVSSLKEKGYANAPLNDLAVVDLEPLAEADAAFLAGMLLAGEGLASPDPKAAALGIAHEVDGFPYYVHHVVKSLKTSGREATPANVALTVRERLVAANDPWQLLHYLERIPAYYGDGQAAARVILDHLAAGPPEASANELLAMLKASTSFDDRERLLRLLSLMERDHYLRRSLDGRFGFRFPLIRRWWKINRGL